MLLNSSYVWDGGVCSGGVFACTLYVLYFYIGGCFFVVACFLSVGAFCLCC